MGAIITRLVRLSSFLASLLLVYVTAHTLIEIVLRTVFGRPTAVVVEFVGYALAGMTYLALADSMRSGSLVRVNILLNFVPPWVRRTLDAFCILLTLVLVLFIAWFFLGDMQRNWSRGIDTDSVVPMPVWIPPMALTMGLVVFALDLIMQFVLVVTGKTVIRDDSSGV